MTVSLELATADIALLSDPIGSRVVLPRLLRADPTETDDSTLVHLEGLELPVVSTGPHTDLTIGCLARFGEFEHDRCLDLIDLFRTARTSADRRLVLRTNAGHVGGFDEFNVGVVRNIPRTRLVGVTHDVPFTFEAVHYELGA